MPPSGLHLAVEALGIKHGGGATVLKDLITAAVSDSRFEMISVFCAPRLRREFDLPESDRVNQIEMAAAEFSRLYRVWWLYSGLELHLQKIKASVLLSLSGAARSRRTPYITLIQQSLPFSAECVTSMSMPQRLRMKTLSFAMRRSCQSSKGVIVQTATMRKTIIDAFGTPSSSIHVIPPAVGGIERGAAPAPHLAPMRNGRFGPRLLYIGNGAEYKNIGRLIEAVEQARKHQPNLTLFLAGPSGHSDDVRPGVVYLGPIPASAVSEAYNLADLFVMPSLVETVGFPLLEAMTAGTAVLAADRPYAREVCEDAAVFFNPLDPDQLSSMMITVLADDALRQDLIRKGLALTEKRRKFRPYSRMLDVTARAATPC